MAVLCVLGPLYKDTQGHTSCSSIRPQVACCNAMVLMPQVSHNTDAVVAGLSFLGQLDRIRDMPVAAKSGGSGAASSSGAAPEPKPEPDMAGGRQPATLSERVKQAFAAHHLPIHNKNDVPFTTLKIACPGAWP